MATLASDDLNLARLKFGSTIWQNYSITVTNVTAIDTSPPFITRVKAANKNYENSVVGLGIALNFTVSVSARLFTTNPDLTDVAKLKIGVQLFRAENTITKNITSCSLAKAGAKDHFLCSYRTNRYPELYGKIESYSFVQSTNGNNVRRDSGFIPTSILDWNSLPPQGTTVLANQQHRCPNRRTSYNQYFNVRQNHFISR